MTASIARFLKDFGEVPPPPPPEASGDFDFGGFPGSDAVVEEPVDIEAERAEAHARGYEAATHELQAKWAEERQALLAAQQAEMAALKARYENEIVDLVQSKLGQIAITVAEAVSDQAAKVLAPLVEEALTDKAIADMADLIRAAVLEGDVATVTVRGPEHLRMKLSEALGDSLPSVLRHVEASDLDVSADLGDPALVTRLSAWSARVKELLA
nr:GTPase [Rhizobium sp. TCK]